MVESRICIGSGGFRRGVEPFVGFGLQALCALGAVVFALGFAPWEQRYFHSGMRGFWVSDERISRQNAPQ